MKLNIIKLNQKNKWPSQADAEDSNIYPTLIIAGKEYFINSGLIKEAKLFLSKKESSRYKKFVSRDDADLFIIGRYLIKKFLSIKKNISPQQILIEEDAYGRPFIVKPRLEKIDFNLSHSGNFIILGVSSKAIGVDIEKKNSSDIERLSETCFTKKEIKYIFCENNNPNRVNRFYKLWTLKEAYLKAIGVGLSYPLKNFYFTINRSNILLKSKIDNLFNKKWHFYSFGVGKKYIISVCLEKL